MPGHQTDSEHNNKARRNSRRFTTFSSDFNMKITLMEKSEVDCVQVVSEFGVETYSIMLAVIFCPNISKLYRMRKPPFQLNNPPCCFKTAGETLDKGGSWINYLIFSDFTVSIWKEVRVKHLIKQSHDSLYSVVSFYISRVHICIIFFLLSKFSTLSCPYFIKDKE